MSFSTNGFHSSPLCFCGGENFNQTLSFFFVRTSKILDAQVTSVLLSDSGEFSSSWISCFFEFFCKNDNKAILKEEVLKQAAVKPCGSNLVVNSFGVNLPI